jgi:hypothetical protein
MYGGNICLSAAPLQREGNQSQLLNERSGLEGRSTMAQQQKDTKVPETHCIGSISSYYEFDDDGKLKKVVIEFEGDIDRTVIVGKQKRYPLR